MANCESFTKSFSQSYISCVSIYTSYVFNVYIAIGSQIIIDKYLDISALTGEDSGSSTLQVLRLPYCYFIELSKCICSAAMFILLRCFNLQM